MLNGAMAFAMRKFVKGAGMFNKGLARDLVISAMISIIHLQGANVSKLRISLRLLGELVLDGVYTNVDEGVHLLHNMVQNIVNSDKVCLSSEFSL